MSVLLMNKHENTHNEERILNCLYREGKKTDSRRGKASIHLLM